MSRKIRFAAALLILASLTCGNLSAFPLEHPIGLGHEGTGTLTVLVAWVASLFSWERAQGKAPKHPRPKMATQLDPDGQH